MKKIMLILLFMMLCLSGVYGVTLTDTQARNLVIGDSYVSEGDGDLNYGTEGNIFVVSLNSSRNYRTYLTFNLSQENITYSLVTNAVLNINQWSDSNSISALDVDFYYCSGTFDETTLTWNNQNTEINNDCEATPFYSYVSNEGNGNKSINLTDIIEDNIFSIKMMMSIESYDAASRSIAYRSKEYATITDRPRLNIDYFPYFFENITANSNPFIDNSYFGVTNINYTISTNEIGSIFYRLLDTPATSFNDGTMTGFDRNDGTVSGGVTIEDGAMVFDGVDDYVDLGTPVSEVTKNGTYSISVWIKPDESTQDKQSIFYNTLASDDRNGMILLNNFIRFGYYDGTQYVRPLLFFFNLLIILISSFKSFLQRTETLL